MSKQNENPIVHTSTIYEERVNVYEKYNQRFIVNENWENDTMEPFDEMEIFGMIKDINDPEHPLTLEQLKVVTLDQIQFDKGTKLLVHFTPTIPHCSMATLIGLCLRVKLLRSLPSSFKVEILIQPGTHASELAVNKQLNDKERVAAALENSHLLDVVHKCIQG